MRIVAIADTHGKHRKVDLPKGDVLVHAGDFSHFGEGKDEFFEWFTGRLFDHRLLILGNHEGRGTRRHTEPLESELRRTEGLTYIGVADITINGLTFGRTGAPHIDVLVTHRPPEGIIERLSSDDDLMETGPESRRYREGNGEIRQILEGADPMVHVFGHVHSAYGRLEHDGRQYVNASVVNQNYEVCNDPVVIDL